MLKNCSKLNINLFTYFIYQTNKKIVDLHENN